MKKTKVLLCWSGGKDCALAFYYLKVNPEIELIGLICTVSASDRVGLHGVRKDLITKQAALMSLPVYFIYTSIENYEEDFLTGIKSLKNRSIQFDNIAFGDIFLVDLRLYREKILKTIAIQPIFPLWLTPTKEISKKIIELKIEAVIICINHNILDVSLLGKKYSQIINSLGAADICGENGEFHTFVYNAPFFSSEIIYSHGETVRNNFNSFLELVN